MAEAAREEDELAGNVHEINVNNATVIAGGEVHLTEVTQVTEEHHHNEYNVQTMILGDVYVGTLGNVEADDVTASGSNNASLEQRVEEKDATLRANQKEAANIKVKSQETVLVKLQVVHRKDVKAEGVHLWLLYIGNEKNLILLDVDEFCLAAKENAIKEAESKFSDQAAKDYYITKHGNFIVITGGAGYGKTTLGLQILQYVCDTQPESGYLFYVNLPSFDNSKDMSPFEFLIKLFNSNWRYQLETDDKIVERISKSNNVWIIIDSMDETDFNLSMKAAVIGLYDRAKPEVILQNLLRGDILGNAFKFLITRPEAYLQLHVDCKSHFPLEVLGLGENSQDLLFKEICQSQEKYKKVKEVLNQNPAANALSFIPLFAKAIPKYILKHGLDDGAFTTTDVFSSFLNDYIRSAHFKKDESVLRKLSELALYGMLNTKFTFEAQDFAEVGLKTKGLEDFLKVQVQSSDISLKILEGDKLVLFNHRMLQEFFSAIKIMFDTPMERFSELLENLKSVKWEMVLQFVFGLLNPELHRKLKALFPISSADVSTKRGLLKDLVVSMAKDFAKTSVKDLPVSLTSLFEYNVEALAKWQEFIARPDDKRLFKLCSLAYESKLYDITRSVVEVFPDMVLLSRTILPGHVASLCHVLRATDKPITINVGAFREPATFIGDGLTMLMETVAGSPHTIRKFHVDEATISIATLAPLIPQMEELAIRRSNLSVEDIKLICESLQRKTRPIELLDLSLNDLDEAGVKLLSGCIPYIERLVLQRCGLTSEHLLVLASSIQQRQHPIELLDLSVNDLDEAGVKLLSGCIPYIERLRLVRCGLTSEHLLVLASSIQQRQHPMDLLNLSENKIGSRGAGCLATSAHKVNQLLLGDCGIDEVGALTEAIARREHPMDLLILSGNKIGSRGAGCLATIAHKVNKLWLKDCGIDEVGALTEAIARREHPMDSLVLDGNKIGSRGAGCLATSAHKVNQLWLTDCGIDEVGALTKAIARRKHPMEILDVRNNPLGDRGASALARCRGKIGRLGSNDCNFTSAGKQELESAERRHQRKRSKCHVM